MTSDTMNYSEGRSKTLPPPGLKVARIGLWLTLAPVMLDYRTPEGTAWAVPLYTTILLISLTGTAILLFRFGLIAWAKYRAVLAIATAYLLISMGSGFYWDNPVDVVLRTAPPLVLYASGMFSIGALMASRLDPRLLWPTVIKAAFVGMILQVIMVQMIVGIDFSTIRYQVLTGAAALVSAFVITALFFGGWKPWLAVMAAVHFALLVVSVTRTHVVIFVAALAYFLAAARERALKVNRIGMMAMGVGTLVLVILLVDSVLPVSPIARWVERFTVVEVSHYGYDITELTRIGEARHQIELLKNSPMGMMFGYGAASPTGMDQETKTVLRFIVGQQEAEWIGQGFGHNNYIGTFFVGGILGGSVLLIMQLWVLTRSFLITRLLSARHYRIQNPLIISAPVGYFAYMVLGTLSPTLGTRSNALMFAITTGFTLWIFGLLENEIRQQKHKARQRKLRRRLIAV